jgi:hypothetical protein
MVFSSTFILCADLSNRASIHPCYGTVAEPKKRSFLRTICFSDASFEVGSLVLKAERTTGDLLK